MKTNTLFVGPIGAPNVFGKYEDTAFTYAGPGKFMARWATLTTSSQLIVSLSGKRLHSSTLFLLSCGAVCDGN